MRAYRTLVATAAAVLALTPTSNAAVRSCSEVLTGSPGVAKTELKAKKAALDDWFALAKAAGYDNAIWRTAAEKALNCVKKDGSFTCAAFGRACGIFQVAPPGSVPLPRVKKPVAAEAAKPSKSKPDTVKPAEPKPEPEVVPEAASPPAPPGSNDLAPETPAPTATDPTDPPPYDPYSGLEKPDAP